jgi:hypothetical protein
VDVGCQTKRTLKLGVATQCDIIKKDNDSFHQDALLHAERHIAKLEAHLGAMEMDAEEFESRVRNERDLAGRRFDELLRLRGALAGQARCDFTSKVVESVQQVDTGAASWASPQEVFELFRRKRGELGVECDQSTSDLMDAQLLEALKGMSAIELRRLLEALKGMSAIEMQRYQADISAQLA